MKKILFITILLLLYSCKAGYIEKEIKGNLFDKFDYQSYKNDYVGFKEGTTANSYIFNDVEFYPEPSDDNDGFNILIYPQKKQLYTVYNNYNKVNYNLKQKGKFFGRGKDSVSEGSLHKLKIGIWYEYDESGKLTKKIDEDKKFGKFGYNELLKFLHKQKQINLNKDLVIAKNGKSTLYTLFHYSHKSDKKLWTVIIDNIDGEYKNGYFIDGNTGKVLKGTPSELARYREIGFEF